MSARALRDDGRKTLRPRSVLMTGWRMTQSAANHSPRPSSLLNRELTGNFGVFGSKMLLARSKKGRLYKGFSANSLLNGTGNNNPRTGNFFGGTGNFQGGAGNLSKPHFFQSSEVWVGEGSRPSRRLAGEGLITLQNDCPPSPWRWRTRMRASSGHCSRAAITIGEQSLRPGQPSSLIKRSY